MSRPLSQGALVAVETCVGLARSGQVVLQYTIPSIIIQHGPGDRLRIT
jgi:hypothetical protein